MIPRFSAVLNSSTSEVSFGKYCYISLRNAQAKAKVQRNEDIIHADVSKSKKAVVISCKRNEFNHFKGQTYNKFKPITLASKGWFHKKSKGDFFTINNTVEGRIHEEIKGIQFRETGLDLSIADFLIKLGFINPTEIQLKGIPSILKGRNTVLAAETGCGKTFAYLLPIIHHVLKWKKRINDRPMNCPFAVIVSPNRELAQQIFGMVREFSEEFDINAKVIVGGHVKRQILNPEFNDVDILIGTFGALSKLVTTGIYKISMVRHVVLDEADSLLDDSFEEKMNPFLRRFQFNFTNDHESGKFPNGVQLTLASATMPRGASERLNEFIPAESLVSVKTKNLHRILGNVKQHFMRLGHSQKPGELLRIVKSRSKLPVMIFSSKTETSQWLSMFLNENGVECLNLNGEMPVEVRAGKFDEFIEGNVQVISCTDIGSRGLNTVQVNHVLNYEFPLHIADYVHRCGRTGRLGSSGLGLVTNFISGPREIDLVQKIELAARTGAELPNVNGNIKRLIIHRISKLSTP
ncbi:probable ATP-dependent RNA helicase DDX28 [Hetaerina americana]|uniref:probable ATP-dependent RNA helicase DDX28 n=1 Tax=Hetaerina americana TaxID=62018 RepID=UPI003A7F2A62